MINIACHVVTRNTFFSHMFFRVVAQDNLTQTDQYLLKTNWCVGAKIILNRFLLFWLQRLGQSKNFSRQIFFSLINSDFKISYTFVSLIVGWKRSFLFTSNTLKPYNWLKEYYILWELLSSATTTWNGLYRPLWNRKTSNNSIPVFELQSLGDITMSDVQKQTNFVGKHLFNLC